MQLDGIDALQCSQNSTSVQPAPSQTQHRIFGVYGRGAVDVVNTVWPKSVQLLFLVNMATNMSPHMAASLALEAYRTRLGAVLSFIDDAAAARIQLPTDPEELTATLDGLLEYFLAGEAAFTASGSELAQHSKRVQSLRAALDALEREDQDTALLIHQLHACSATADASIAAAMDTADALRAAAASGTCPDGCGVCNLRRCVPSPCNVGCSARAEARNPRVSPTLTSAPSINAVQSRAISGQCCVPRSVSPPPRERPQPPGTAKTCTLSPCRCPPKPRHGRRSHSRCKVRFITSALLLLFSPLFLFRQPRPRQGSCARAVYVLTWSAPTHGSPTR
jgi:hypothetical protein